MKRICSVDNCNLVATRRGWCSPHYKRWQRHGDVQADRAIGRMWFGQYNRGRTKPVFDPLADDEL